MNNNARVVVLKTTPETACEDYLNLLQQLDCRSFFDNQALFSLIAESGFDSFFPAVSVTPWQLDGVLKSIASMGHGTAGIDFLLRGRKKLIDKNGLSKFVGNMAKALSSSEHSISNLLERLEGRNVIVLGNMRTHLVHTITGTVISATLFLRPLEENWLLLLKHGDICDRLRALKKHAKNVIGVMDATFAGDGAGPRCVRIFAKNFILASDDLVALDAVAAKMMGFEPLSIPHLRTLHDEGLGCADLAKINVIGTDISHTDFRFLIATNRFSRFFARMVRKKGLDDDDQKKRHFFILAMLEWMQVVYARKIWLKKTGKSRLSLAAKSPWGKLLQEYGLLLS